jgi:DNA-binding MarR family transcriptional regulator
MKGNNYHQLQVLEILGEEPDITQADLAARVGIAVGTVNWYLKRWSAKGLIKIRRINRWRWRYILTPEGVAEKTILAGKYLDATMHIYRRTREDAREIIGEIKSAGYSEVVLDGQSDLLDICALTCLELDLDFSKVSQENDIPVVRLNGTRLELIWPENL